MTGEARDLPDEVTLPQAVADAALETVVGWVNDPETPWRERAMLANTLLRLGFSQKVMSRAGVPASVGKREEQEDLRGKLLTMFASAWRTLAIALACRDAPAWKPTV